MGAIALGVGGLAAGIGGSVLQGQAAGRNARAQRNYINTRTGEGYQRLLNLIYGSGAGNPADWSKPGGTPPTPSQMSILGSLAGISNYGEAEGNRIRGDYGRDSARLGALATEAEGMARNWGQGRGQIIRQDSADDLRNRNDVSRAALAASGFGNSTAVGNQLGANAESVGRNRDRALQDLSEAQIDRQLGTRTQRLSVEGGRASGRTGLDLSVLNSNLGLRRAPIDTELQAGMSSIANPWLSRPEPTYAAGGGAGAGLQALGSGLTAFGSYKLGQQDLQSLLNQSRYLNDPNQQAAINYWSTNVP